MSVWRFDESRADFRPAAPGEIEADPDALYIIQRGDVLMVREDGHERPMPERLDVAGVMFDREQFEGNHTLSLRAEMRRDGQWARAQLQARDRGEVSLPLELPIWVTKTPLTIEDMNEIAAAGWAGKLGDTEGKA
ncbi:hypothetical protein JE842_002787 [Escherichia coli]|nr:hypothetical protein [Escherichia coli]EHR2288755.1 hypothetical protein [Escherichia coli]